MSKYEIAKEFRDGMINAIGVKTIPQPEPSSHWVAGWIAGKCAMHEKLNEYLESIGVEKMGVITTAEPKP